MPDITPPLTWADDTFRNATNMNVNETAIVDGLSDGTKDITTTSITGDLVGNASTATRFETARDITLTGDVTGTASFDGSSDLDLSSTDSGGVIAATSVSYFWRKDIEDVRLNHIDDVDADGTSVSDVGSDGRWVNTVMQSMCGTSGASSDINPKGNSNLDRDNDWAQLSTTPLSSAEKDVLTSTTLVYSDSLNVDTVSMEDGGDSEFLKIEFSTSLGTNPHDYVVLQSSHMLNTNDSSSDNDNTFTYPVIPPYTSQYLGSQNQFNVTLQRDDELNPTRLIAYVHKNFLIPPVAWKYQNNLFTSPMVTNTMAQVAARLVSISELVVIYGSIYDDAYDLLQDIEGTEITEDWDDMRSFIDDYNAQWQSDWVASGYDYDKYPAWMLLPGFSCRPVDLLVNQLDVIWDLFTLVTDSGYFLPSTPQYGIMENYFLNAKYTADGTQDTRDISADVDAYNEKLKDVDFWAAWTFPQYLYFNGWGLKDADAPTFRAPLKWNLMLMKK